MARDNGSRGSYRRSSSPANELKVTTPLPHAIICPTISTNRATFVSKSQENVSQDRDHKQRLESLISPISRASSSPNTATPPSTFQNLKRLDALDGNGFLPTADGLFDTVPELLNSRFPAMSQRSRSVPGDLPRRSLSFLPNPFGEEEQGDRVTWVDVAIANFMLGATAIGFLVIMFDGISTILGFFLYGIMGMFISL